VKVRFTTSAAGAGVIRNAGDVADLPDTEAVRLLNDGHAVPVKASPTLETADQEAELETAEGE
jgi:hypothetical protein